MVASNPRWFARRALPWVNHRLRAETGTSFFPLLASALAGRSRVDGLTLTSHHFMSPHELDTDTGRARLTACVFRLPINGEMVPMCQVNAGGVREEFYRRIMPEH
jgi:hypothetical protein